MLACPAAQCELSSTYSSGHAGHATTSNEIISKYQGVLGKQELSQDGDRRFRACSITSHIFGDETVSWDGKASRGQCRSDMTKCGHSGVSGEVFWVFNGLRSASRTMASSPPIHISTRFYVIRQRHPRAILRRRSARFYPSFRPRVPNR